MKGRANTAPEIELVESQVARCDRGYETPCLIFMGTINDKGYGRISKNGKTIHAHQVMYRQYVGEVPAGLELDHLCRQRDCCEPSHLEAVTHAENMRRSRKTHCELGHGEYVVTGRDKRGYENRTCPTCRRAWYRKWQRERRARLRQQASA